MELTAGQFSIVVAQIAMGIGLAASAGLRAFLPLLVVGIAGRLDWLPLTARFEWLESTPALVVFAVAVVVEVLGDKIPAIDHLLDSAQTFVKPVAGTILAASVLSDLSPLQATVIGLITGGVVAETVHLTKASLRVASTAATVGLANPVLSAAEDVVALTGSLLAIVVPFLLALLTLVGIAAAWWGIRRMTRRDEARQ